MLPPFSPADYGSSSESEDIARTNRTRARQSFIRSPNPTDSHFRFLALTRRSSSISSATSRSDSPLPQFYPSQSSSYPSDSENEHSSPLAFDFVNRDACWREDRRAWSPLATRRRRKKSWRITRCLRWLVHLPFFPNQPTTIVRYFTSLKLAKRTEFKNRFSHSFCFLFLPFLSHCFSFTFSTLTRVLYHGERTALCHPLPLHSTGPPRPSSPTCFPTLLQEWQSHLSHLRILILCPRLDCSLACSQSILPLNVECLSEQLGLAIHAAEMALARVMAAGGHRAQ